MLKKILGFFKGDASPTSPVGGLEKIDVEAIDTDLRYAAGKDAALARSLLAYVLNGAEDSALLRLKAINPSERWANYSGAWDFQNKRKQEREAIFIHLKGWDAPAMKRLGEILAIIYEASYHRSSDHPHWPAWLSALRQSIDAICKWDDRDRHILKLSNLLELLALDHLGVAELLMGSFQGGKHLIPRESLVLLADAQPQAFAQAIDKMDAEGRIKLVAEIAEMGRVGVDPILDAVMAMAANSSKATRAAAMAALQGVEAGKLRAKAEALLGDKDSDIRLAGVRILGGIVGPASADLLKAHSETEKSKKILQAIDEAHAAFGVMAASPATQAHEDSAAGYVAIDGRFIALPPRPPLDEDTPLPPAAVTILREALIAQTEIDRREADKYNAANPAASKRVPQPYDSSKAAVVIKCLNGDALSASDLKAAATIINCANNRWSDARLKDAADKIFALPGATVHHAFRFVETSNSSLKYNAPATAYLAHRVVNGFDLRLIADRQGAAANSIELLRELRGDDYDGAQFELSDIVSAGVWPWVVERFDKIDELLGKVGNLPHNSVDPLELLTLLPAPPRRYMQVLVDQAIGGDKANRRLAKAALAKTEALTPLIAGVLRSGEQNRRAAAANWLAERGDSAALPALREAIAGERSDLARAAILSAMSRLGEDISRFFADDILLAEAKKALPKLKSKLHEWLPDTALPDVAWADGRPVPRDIVRYWLLLSEKLKMPGGNPMLNIGLDRLKPEDAARLGLTIMAAFVDYDTLTATEAEANAYAQANAQARFQGMSHYYDQYTLERAFADLKREKLSAYLNSASEHRGILALATRAPGADAARLVRAFVKNHNPRASQCRALVECLAANPSPAALQVVLGISRRHKTPGLQKLAGELVTQIAESNNWTLDEMADRTAPTAGFDEDGIMDLEIGDKIFRALIDPEFKVVLENPDGKTIAALPSPGGEAEAAQAAAAKKLVSNARKELKQTIEAQTGLLYEAMCSGRVWRRADFELFVLRHPILGRLVARLVLAATDEAGKIEATFRILDDKTLTDAKDEPVELEKFDAVRIAHQALVDASTTAAWLTHLKDYDVKPLFAQFGRPQIELKPDEIDENVIIDQRGYMIETFKLRGAATKLGYQRGQAQDGGAFYTYEKRFGSAGVTALIEFTGSGLPEENVAAALTGLRFVKSAKGGAWGKSLPPSSLPSVMVSEVRNDMHRIAEQGSGFAADWREKAYF